MTMKNHKWYSTTILVELVTIALIFLLPNYSYLLQYARYIFGSIFILFLPGFTCTKVLFSAKTRANANTKEMDKTELVTLSIGLSLALTPIVSFVLNYTPWGIQLTTITLSLFGITTALATAALYKEYRIENSSLPEVQ